MKKTKMILSSFLLALALTFGGAFSTTAYANDDPQGTSGTPKAAPAPQQAPPGFWEAILAALAAIGL